MSLPGQATGERSPSTKDRILRAAVEAIRTRGGQGASARAIGQIAGVNQALIYYHFDDMKGLLLAALQTVGEDRLERYRRETRDIHEIGELVDVGRSLYAEDAEQGTLTVLSELVSACLAYPELRPAVTAQLDPWIGFAQDLLERLVSGTILEPILPTRDIAQAMVAFYMGMQTLSRLDGDTERAGRLFDMLSAVAPLAAPILGSTPGGSPRSNRPRRAQPRRRTS